MRGRAKRVLLLRGDTPMYGDPRPFIDDANAGPIGRSVAELDFWLYERRAWLLTPTAMKALADSMSADSPAHYVSTISKAKRQGKILIDYLRNGRGATAVAPYSTRARAGAPVSMPLAFDELGPGILPNHFTVENVPARLAGLDSDHWADFRKAEAPLSFTSKKGKRSR